MLGVMDMTAQEIENRIARVDATMAMEGMPLTEENKDLLRKINDKSISEDEAKKQIIKKYNLKRR